MLHSPDWTGFESCSSAVPLFAPPPCVKVSLQGLDFVSGSRERDRITIAGWDGWTNGTSRTGGPVAWEHADAGVKADVFEESRRITLEGLIIERTPVALWERMEELGAILTRPRWAQLVVEEEHLGLVRQIEVTRLQKPMITPRSSRLAAYTLELEAAGFLRQDVESQTATLTAAGVDVRNLGTAPAPTSAQLVGPLTNPGITWPGGAWTYTGTIASGTTINVDMDRRVVRNPATTGHSRQLVSGSWLAIPPGTTRLTRTGSGSGRVSVTWRSSWS
jgi:hypothetical protein